MSDDFHASAIPERAITAPSCRPRRKITDVVRRPRNAAPRAPRSESPQDGLGGRMMPREVDDAWRALIEETLPPDKREALMSTYFEEKDPRMRYNMLLEFSGYLRQQGGVNDPGFEDGTYDDPDEKYRPKRRPTPGRSPFDDPDDGNLCWEIVRVLLIVGLILGVVIGGAYYLSKEVGASLDEDHGAAQAQAAARSFAAAAKAKLQEQAGVAAPAEMEDESEEG